MRWFGLFIRYVWEMWHIFDKMVDRDVVSWTTTIDI